VEGAIVTAVQPGSAAARTGLQAGDILYGVNRRRVRTVKELLAALQAGRPLQVALLRGENPLTLVIR
jgi:serine protease Do/serine protease DegQ